MRKISVGVAGEAGFYRLVKQGLVTSSGTGNYRVIIVKGVGETIPRLGKAERIAINADFEPERVVSYSCPRCGARNCARHSASFLTTSIVPAWRAA